MFVPPTSITRIAGLAFIGSLPAPRAVAPVCHSRRRLTRFRRTASNAAVRRCRGVTSASRTRSAGFMSPAGAAAIGEHRHRQHARHVGDRAERVRDRVHRQQQPHGFDRKARGREIGATTTAAPLGTPPMAKLVTTAATTTAAVRAGSMATSYRRPTKNVTTTNHAGPES